jgi:serine protease inhibitor
MFSRVSLTSTLWVLLLSLNPWTLSFAGPLESAMNQFSFDLAKQISTENNEQNIVIAAPSVHYALGLAYLGTGPGSNTQREMAEVLHFGDGLNSLSDLAIHYPTWASHFATKSKNSGPQVKIANQIVINEKAQIKRKFLRFTQIMNAPASVKDFNRSSTL